MLQRLVAAIGVAAISGCAMPVQPSAVQAFDIYKVNEEKISGHYVLAPHSSMRDVTRETIPGSQVCSAYSFPVTLGNSFVTSTRAAMEEIFEQVTEGDARAADVDGVINVRLVDFVPRFSCVQRMWSVSCSATTEVGLGVEVRRGPERLFASSVSGSRTTEGDPGGACEKVPSIIEDSIRSASKEVLERVAERIAATEKLRPQAAVPK
jgi:hypothetical protein